MLGLMSMHNINFNQCEILDKASYRHRATPEFWHTATTPNIDNNSQHLPEQYRFLLNKKNNQFHIKLTLLRDNEKFVA